MRMIRKAIFLLVICFGFSSCNQKISEEPVMYLIPSGFEGQIVVFYEQTGGVPREYEGKYRVYNIPSSGVFRTQFEYNQRNELFDEYFFVTSAGERIPIPHAEYGDKRNKQYEGVHVISGESGSVNWETTHENGQFKSSSHTGIFYTTEFIGRTNVEIKKFDIPRLADSLKINKKD